MPTPEAKIDPAPAAMQRQLESPADREADEDSTTLKVSGPIRVTDEDAGGDPYNRTGKFRRAIR